MPAVVFPRRIRSTPVSVTVSGLPAWVPPPGQFGTVSTALASAVNPDDGTKAYRGTQGFRGIWTAYNGGAYAPTLGALGSMLFFGGGHDAWEGNCVVRYDLAARGWELFTQPDDTGTVKGYPDRSLDSDSVNDRVGVKGQYIKDGWGNPYPNTDVDGAATTDWKPYPVHTNCGITFVPADAGGGPLGSLVFVGHDQTGIRVVSPGKVWRLDLSTKVWSVIDYNFSQSYSVHGCEYDSHNKVLWLARGSSSPLSTVNYVTGTIHHLSSPNFNNTGDYANLCFVPGRNLLVRITGTARTVQIIPVGNYVHGATTALSPYNALVSGTPPAGLANTYGANDKLDYCALDGCLYYLDRGPSTATTVTLFKLTPPPVGQEQSGTWAWSTETVSVQAGDARGTYACNSLTKQPTWGGRARFIPAIKSIVLSDLHTLPVQAVRSSNWV